MIIQYNFYVLKTYHHINLLKLINKQINSAIYYISTVNTQKTDAKTRCISTTGLYLAKILFFVGLRMAV